VRDDELTQKCGRLDPHEPHRWARSISPARSFQRWCPGVNKPSGIEIGAMRSDQGKMFIYNGKEWNLMEPEQSGEGWDRPGYYGGEDNPFEPIKIIEYYDLNFNLGCVIKYVLRAPFKGSALADLKKAYTYIGFEIRRRERAGETE
jgi:hypothetical protein